MRILLFISTALLVSGCTAEPRSRSYFVAHPEEATSVLADCASGAHKGQECVNAQAAVVAAERKARIELYDRSIRR